MIKDTKFRPGTSGCPEKQFMAGNRHRWPSGVSGNPAGVSRARLNFERQFHEALVNEGSVGEAAELLWKAARNGEAWAIQNLCQRFAPQAANLHVTHEVGDDGIDYSKLTDQQLEQLEAILERARDQTDPSDRVVEGRAVRHGGGGSGLGKPEASNCIPRTEREDDDAQKSHLQG
jgi:hypothetical protein